MINKYESSVFRVFPNDPIPQSVDRAVGLKIYTDTGDEILDVTGGGTSYAILGWSHPEVISAIHKQLTKFAHMDYKIWNDPNIEILADILLLNSKHKLDRVYFSGNSGAEACEAAMKMSYQYHYDRGDKLKKWFISREQSYHGSTSDALVLGERPNLEFFRPMLSPFRSRIPMHHPLNSISKGETLDEYALKSAKELEDRILEIGPENVAGFVAETMMGGLVGDVPPAPNYWKYIRRVCTKYGVHLILDEVYCGTGTTGKYYCCDWDDVRPDFIFIGKTLAAGYGVLSAVITSKEIENTIKLGQGRLQHTTTHQAHSLSVAAAITVQKIILSEGFLENVNKNGEYFRNSLTSELADNNLFKNIRGRGLRFSLEFDCINKNNFAKELQDKMFNKHKILINSKWHRVCFTPSLEIEKNDIDRVVEKFSSEFKILSKKYI